MAEVIMEGMEDLTSSLEHLVMKYPDRAGDFLMKQGRETRKGAAKEMRSQVRTDTSERYSLGKLGNYRLTLKGYGTAQEVELSARSPHFHLIEHGHAEYDFRGFPTGGFVRGYHIMDTERKKREQKIHGECMDWAEDILKEEGFL